MIIIFPQASTQNLIFSGEYQLLSSHEKAVNLVNQFSHLISLHPSIRYLSPFGIAFRQDDFRYLRSACHQSKIFLAKHKNILNIGHVQIAPSNRKIRLKLLPYADNNINGTIFSKFDLEINGFGVNNGEMLHQKSAPVDSIIEFLLSPSVNTARHIVKNIGFGKGLTPSFDDVLIGVLAIMYWKNQYLPYISPLTNAILEVNLDRYTTTLSKHFLLHALIGEFSYPLLKLISAFKYDAKSIQYAVATFIQHGHTSGRDTLLGVVAALQHFNK